MESLWAEPHALSLGGRHRAELGLWYPPEPGPSRGHCGRSCMGWPVEDFCPLWKEPDLALALTGCVTFSKSLSFSRPLVGRRGLRFFGPRSPPEATGWVQPGPPSWPARPGAPPAAEAAAGWAGRSRGPSGVHCLAASSQVLPPPLSEPQCPPLGRDSLRPSSWGSGSNETFRVNDHIQIQMRQRNVEIAEEGEAQRVGGRGTLQTSSQMLGSGGGHRP